MERQNLKDKIWEQTLERQTFKEKFMEKQFMDR